MHCNTSAEFAFHDCGMASEKANDVDIRGASQVFRTDIEVDIAPLAVEAVAVAEGVVLVDLGDKCKEA